MYGGKLFQAAVVASSLLACAAYARAQDISARLFDATRQRTERDAQAAQKDWAEYLKRQVVERNSLGMELVVIPPGKFKMGSPNSEISPIEKP